MEKSKLMLRRKFSKTVIIVNTTISLILIALALLIVANRQRIIDQITVWQFHPTSAITSLVDRAGMNGNGKFLYLSSQPALDATQNFNNECDRIENTTSILGCYSNYRIFIYDVTDKKLDGVREVTAAHETLHAAYARLGSDEKDKINVLLEAEYKKLENNKDYVDRMAFYARTEPGERDNELHSVIGTEIANINPDLEKYYDNYFSDRQKVVALNTKYSSVFINLKAHANVLLAQLNSLSEGIGSATERYNSDVKTLNADIFEFNRRANNGSFQTQSQFNYERAVLSARVDELDVGRAKIDADLALYDQTLAEYNSIASESKKLYNSIDSTLAPAPTV
ncbi:hypothetical protein COV88_00795 [Candidatus Saccharibacteria bacterium CG11_big_fil_rev_8_21_14_0_20_41_19]|nr:MAG: hypothetical protein COV88_00795 [Candidatus Saccharibacteria bacterium CG11_big_fil_rev_8_21_14_0_20_41_19]PIZ59454.1 MAG: hypothetical protein COY18_03655 [Candidatus Saccharibacteria bacterium CG_4_10_14_0_2_um_filter_41_11]PJC29918.1 MAG: hypothetical protein CO052_00720 [Candidatus Saccharibacteria bacterium CG_4_9_14_0_2_um_filter_41_9]PJE66086.1 MAG: hypothetical protein COU92_02685 [Candidatus Saccharibacteria bacterium CG10_big_fil_rev_8_21_14_0_10_41_32]